MTYYITLHFHKIVIIRTIRKFRSYRYFVIRINITYNSTIMYTHFSVRIKFLLLINRRWKKQVITMLT